MAKRVLLGLDAFGVPTAQLPGIRLARVLQRTAGFEVEPVFVLSATGRGLRFTDRDLAYWLPRAEAELGRLVRGIRRLDLLPPRILIGRTLLLRNDAKLLMAHAAETGAEAVIISSYAEAAAPERWLFGSFARTLLVRASVPVLVTTERARGVRALESILFATDLTEPSRTVLRRLVDFASTLRARVTLFHVRPRRGARAGAEEQMASLVAESRRRVPCEGVVEPPKDEPLPDAIHRAARERRADLVAMAAMTGPLRAALLGSRPRETLRGCDCPLWVCGPRLPA
jgi:nucleotide-binding universal stress UspA family protein